ncbi:hypothetical protein JSY36_09815 [Bacillus sp. H-16]|uniref:hypothetical protein n=1 Tax=Alteribacter salitolerans TaxID=2912333 RepID=UPI001965C1EB|nr:hypothetical protein [Alteribacter salitolerans]MBM7096051.1 hypothetical protein [Alteribacter salitolerans]
MIQKKTILRFGGFKKHARACFFVLVMEGRPIERSLREFAPFLPVKLNMFSKVMYKLPKSMNKSPKVMNNSPRAAWHTMNLIEDDKWAKSMDNLIKVMNI